MTYGKVCDARVQVGKYIERICSLRERHIQLTESSASLRRSSHLYQISLSSTLCEIAQRYLSSTRNLARKI